LNIALLLIKNIILLRFKILRGLIQHFINKDQFK